MLFYDYYIMELRFEKSAEDEYECKTQILHIVNIIATSLFGAENEDVFKTSLSDSLKLLADFMGLDRIFIWRNEKREDGLYFTLMYEWMKDEWRANSPVKIGQTFSYDTDAPVWKEKFLQDKCVYIPIDIAPKDNREPMESAGVKSILAVPIHLHGMFWGAVHFDICHSEHTLKNDDIDILQSASLIIASAINRNLQTIALSEAHEYAKLMLDTTPLACNLWNGEKKLIDCNKKTLEIFGFESKEEYEKNFFELSPEYQPDGRFSADTVKNYLNDTIKKGNMTLEWMHQFQNGDPLPVEVNLTRVNLGNNIFIAAYLRDLREQKRMMLEIEQRDMLLQTVNQAASILLDARLGEFENNLSKSMGMIARAVGADRVYIWKNTIHNGELCSTQVFQWSDSYIPPLVNDDQIVNVSYNNTIPDLKEMLSRGECINRMARDMPERTREYLSDAMVLSFFLAPIFVQDKFWGFVGFDDCHRERIFTKNEVAILRSGCLLIGNAYLRHNMTVKIKEKAEEAKAASRLKTAFLANMSHEIRTPMNSIVGFSELALDGDNPPKTKDYLVKILKNSEWLLQIINDILDISKIESGKMELESIPFDLHEMFAACRTVIMPKALEKGLAMHFYAEPSVGKRLYGDPTKLRQVLVNLLSNAVKFTNNGMIKMQAAVKEIGENSVTMYFEVRDSGIGVSPEQLKKIFDPFVQGESGTTRKFGGSGLGLPITKNIIELMGGKLDVKSVHGVGSKFSFELVFNAVDAANDNLPDEKIVFEDIEKPTFEGCVLLCEDNAMNQQVICEHLARVGLKTDVAQNGKLGVEMVKNRTRKGEKQYDLIFMDIHMPVMDGLEAAAKISGFNASIPIVALTANVMSNDRELYLSRGMSDCIGKPFMSQELWRCLMKYFEPVTWQKEDVSLRRQSDGEMRQLLINNFVKDNSARFKDISDALNSHDIKLAHRLTHTLKSNAGHIGKTLLYKAAEEVEDLLKDGENMVTEQHMETLKIELNTVINELSPLVCERVLKIADDLLDKDAALEIFNKLEHLLENRNIDSLSFTDDLQMIPGSGDLIQQIENFDFNRAKKTLIELKKEIFS